MKEAPVSKKDWLERFKLWLEEETEGSEMLVDEKWNVEIDEENDYLVTSSFLSPMSVAVFLREEDEQLYANMVVNMGMKTASLASEKRLDIYRKLLLLNDRSQMVKYTLSGIDEEVTIRTDLDLVSLNKKEFSDALINTLGASTTLATIFDFEEEYGNAWVMNMVSLLAADIVEGRKSHDKVKHKLKTSLGFDDETVDMVMGMIDGFLKENKLPPDGPDAMFG